LPEANLKYEYRVREYSFTAVFNSEKAVGFIAMLPHNRYHSEIYVMGVSETCHRKGIGRELIERVKNRAKEKGRFFPDLWGFKKPCLQMGMILSAI